MLTACLSCLVTPVQVNAERWKYFTHPAESVQGCTSQCRAGGMQVLVKYMLPHEMRMNGGTMRLFCQG